MRNAEVRESREECCAIKEQIFGKKFREVREVEEARKSKGGRRS